MSKKTAKIAKIAKTTKTAKSKKTKVISSPKEAEILDYKKYTEGDMEITETVKKIDSTTDILTTPWGTKVGAKDVLKVLEEYYALSPEDKQKEKEAWVSLISSMMGEREDGLKIVDIVLSPTGSREIKFVYR